MHPHDRSPVTDTELARAMQAVEDAALVFDALLEVADERQKAALIAACPFQDWKDTRLDYGCWLSVVIDGTTGLKVQLLPERRGERQHRSGVAS